MIKSPSEEGFIMPAEWNKHAATLLHWPSNSNTWPAERLDRVEKVYLEIIRHLHKYEDIILLIDISIDHYSIRDKLLKDNIDLRYVHLYPVPINDVWARDCGPIFICKNGLSGLEYAITDWEYNSWGCKYPPFDSDNKIPQWFSDHFNLNSFNTGMILEGGSIDTNGEGIFLTTESVLLNQNRNPNLSRTEIETKLDEYLGAKQIIWLKDGLIGDDTDGHIDDLSRFLNRNTILTMICDDPKDVNYETLQTNLEILEKAVNNLNGESFHILTLPLPKTRIEGTTVDGSEYVPASYANFYIANGVVLVPLYDEEYDSIALSLFQQFYPDRDIIGIHCSDLVWGQGSIHCVTQQIYGIGEF
ncbi:MAG: agmatine deiminase family protein [Balneolaceae bacterium]